MVSIYTLSDPITNEIRYVGKTIQSPTKRLNEHIIPSGLKSPTLKNNWVKSLLKKNLLPIIEVLEEVCEEDWQAAESYWISQFKAWGFKLTNMTAGGEGNNWLGRTHKEETKQKIALSGLGEKNSGYGGKHKKAKRIHMLDNNDNIIKTFDSIADATRDLGNTSIVKCLKGKNKTAAGYKWTYCE